MKRITGAVLAAFVAGYIASDLASDLGIRVVGNAEADVAGMNWSELQSDYDFKKAVRKVVEKYCEAESDGDMSC